jgi:hypothetical protein
MVSSSCRERLQMQTLCAPQQLLPYHPGKTGGRPSCTGGSSSRGSPQTDRSITVVQRSRGRGEEAVWESIWPSEKTASPMTGQSWSALDGIAKEIARVVSRLFSEPPIRPFFKSPRIRLLDRIARITKHGGRKDRTDRAVGSLKRGEEGCGLKWQAMPSFGGRIEVGIPLCSTLEPSRTPRNALKKRMVTHSTRHKIGRLSFGISDAKFWNRYTLLRLFSRSAQEH